MMQLLEGSQCLSPSTARDDSPIPESPVLPRSPRSRLSARSITKLAECRHFHLTSVELGPIGLSLVSVQGDKWTIRVESEGDSWEIERKWEEIVEFDQQLHRCVFERRHSKLEELLLVEGGASGSSPETPSSSSSLDMPSSRRTEALRHLLHAYLARLSRLTGSLMTCFPVLRFLEVDSRGRHFSPPEMSAINTPAIAAAIVTKEFIASSPDQLTIHVGDILSIIEMCSRVQKETTWWKAKLTISRGGTVRPAVDENQNTYKIGLFPSNCVQVFDDKGLHSSPPTAHKHFSAARKVSDLLRRGVRRRNPVFGVELTLHLERANRRVPLILERCVAAIEKHGIITGIYRQCGIQSNIQRLRAKFDAGADPDLFEFAIVRDVYCVSSLLKQYFRQLPNPLFTFELYQSLLEAFGGGKKEEEKNQKPNESPEERIHRQKSIEEEKIHRLKATVEMLPPSHYNTARYLFRHLSRLCSHTSLTDMTSKNLAIVWTPNLFRQPPSVDTYLLDGLHVRTELCGFLMEHTEAIFGDPALDFDEGIHNSVTASSLTATNMTNSPLLTARHRSFHDINDVDEVSSLRKSSSDSRWSRVFRGKSVDGLSGGFNARRRTINGAEPRRQREYREEVPIREEDIKWRRSHSTDAAFRASRSESLLSMITKGYEEIRDGVRSWTKRAYSLRPRSRPPPSPQLLRRPRIERMHDSITISTISRVSTSDAINDRPLFRENEIREESPESSLSGSLKDLMTAKEKRVAFRNQDRYASPIPLGERSSPVEEWSSESRNSPLLEMSRYDNVSPARPREHVINRVVAGFDLPPPQESPSPSSEDIPRVSNGHTDLYSIPNL